MRRARFSIIAVIRGGGFIDSRAGRITVLWALSESALGGVLHAINIPFAGLFIGSGAVIFISLLIYYSEDRRTVFRSVMVVLLIKVGVSPHSPPLSYFAVALQGAVGYLMVLPGRMFRVTVFLFGITVLFLSSVQKILLLTIIYGKNLWASIDQLGFFITEKIPYVSSMGKTSLWLIGGYALLHVLAGAAAGYFAGTLPARVEQSSTPVLIHAAEPVPEFPVKKNKGKRKGNWFRRPSTLLVAALAAVITGLTYIYPDFFENAALRALVMIIRSVLIMGLWIFVISPMVTRGYQKFFQNRKGKYAGEVDRVLADFPRLRAVVAGNWKCTAGLTLHLRIKRALASILVHILRNDTGGPE